MQKKLLIAVIGISVILFSSIGVFVYYHPTYYKFNDRFIIGSTVEEITAKYGNFTSIGRNPDGEIYRGAYKVRDNTPEWFLSYDNSLWYEIYFENGIAVSVRLQEGWYGG